MSSEIDPSRGITLKGELLLTSGKAGRMSESVREQRLSVG